MFINKSTGKIEIFFPIYLPDAREKSQRYFMIVLQMNIPHSLIIYIYIYILRDRLRERKREREREIVDWKNRSRCEKINEKVDKPKHRQQIQPTF